MPLPLLGSSNIPKLHYFCILSKSRYRTYPLTIAAIVASHISTLSSLKGQTYQITNVASYYSPSPLYPFHQDTMRPCPPKLIQLFECNSHTHGPPLILCEKETHAPPCVALSFSPCGQGLDASYPQVQTKQCRSPGEGHIHPTSRPPSKTHTVVQSPGLRLSTH